MVGKRGTRSLEMVSSRRVANGWKWVSGVARVTGCGGVGTGFGVGSNGVDDVFFFLFVFLILRRMAKNKAEDPTLPRIRFMSCFDLAQRSRCNSSSRCYYRAREHDDPT